MPKLNRRHLIQAAGAAGLASLIPAMPASAAPLAGSATPSQMLWASLYKKAGNSENFAALARSMGVSGKAAHGIHTKLAQRHALAA
jgi:hypothetical protein